MKHLLSIAFLSFYSSMCLKAQFSKLDSLTGFNLKVYYSKGQKERAVQVAKLSDNAIVYNKTLVNFKPTVSLLILSPADWPEYTKFPVYGMPHYTNDEILVVAAEDNPFWQSFIPPLDQLPPSLADQIRKVYVQKGKLSMQPFFDLLALHELGHAYHKQASLNVQRKWMGELFCNIFLHTYIAENKPELLPALTLFPNMVVQSGNDGYSFTTLDQFESNYEEIATRYPKNYGWYQCRLHVEARKIYDAGGKSVFTKLWQALKMKGEKGDNEFARQLATEVHQAVADVVLKW